MTPRLYPENSHRGLGYFVFWISILVLGGDVFRLLRQIAASVLCLGQRFRKTTLKRSKQTMFINCQKEESYDALEEENMLSSLEEENHGWYRDHSNDLGDSGRRQVRFAQDHNEDGVPRQWSTTSSTRQNYFPDPFRSASKFCINTPQASFFGQSRQQSLLSWKLPLFSNGTCRSTEPERVRSSRQYDDPSNVVGANRGQGGKQILESIFCHAHVTVARLIPIISFAAVYTGLAVYSGSCRGHYKNVCLAHGIKGGIFFWYGVLSFARYLGAFADLGWAWNRQPIVSDKGGSTAVSAEFVECFVIFFYGVTNTWMERFEASSGDPYTVKQVQHISIAVMFWFAGLVGIILETQSFKNLLALPVALKQAAIRAENTGTSAKFTCEEAVTLPARPTSYAFPFNPFPALVIGVTGVAMAAHHQDYVYEVSVHSLWGNLLAGFSVCRTLSYFFLWLRPPTSSIMPSRPPTEALASFCLASGGFVFMLSSEEVSFVVMRNDFGDIMMILNLTVAIVSLIFCSIAGLMIVKALAVRKKKQKSETSSVRLDQASSLT